MKTVKIYSDGSTREVCYVIEGRAPVRRPARESGESVTCNEGEYLACLAALEAARKAGIRKVELRADSELMVKQLTLDPKGKPLYDCKNLRLQQLRLLVLAESVYFDELRFVWIPREQNLAGHELERKIKKEKK